MRSRVCVLAGILLLTAAVSLGSDSRVALGATVPSGFNDYVFAGNLPNPTAMEFAPDGRLFVALQTGQLRVISGGILLPTPFISLTVDSVNERGLLGIAFHPNFASNQWIYLYYTVPGSPPHNRVSRFTANGDVAAAGETIILELENLNAGNHNGGAIHFGIDGKLYVAVGDNANGGNSQVLTNRLGKMLRVNENGSTPSGGEANPTSFPDIMGSPTGVNQAIWAVGLRNPFTFAIQPKTGRMFINDVGDSGGGATEEVNNGVAGANYGWPNSEGPSTDPADANHTFPFHSYNSGLNPECAITGGAFYNPAFVQFPAEYLGKYFFSDYCGDWIRYLDPAATPPIATASAFALALSAPVDLKVGADGALYYLNKDTATVGKIDYDTDNDGYPDKRETDMSENSNLKCNIMRADVNHDGTVTIGDFAIVASQFLLNSPPTNGRFDQDTDKVITIGDLAAMAAEFLQPVTNCPNS